MCSDIYDETQSERINAGLSGTIKSDQEFIKSFKSAKNDPKGPENYAMIETVAERHVKSTALKINYRLNHSVQYKYYNI